MDLELRQLKRRRFGNAWNGACVQHMKSMWRNRERSHSELVRKIPWAHAVIAIAVGMRDTDTQGAHYDCDCQQEELHDFLLSAQCRVSHGGAHGLFETNTATIATTAPAHSRVVLRCGLAR